MKIFKAFLGLLICLLAVFVVHGASVTVSRNITVKPTPDLLTDLKNRVDITLECICSQSDLSYYMKNPVSWSKVTNTGQTVKLTDGFYSSRENAQYFNGSFANYSLDYKANTGPGYMFRLTIKGLKNSDDGEYTCTLFNERKAVLEKKTVKVTVVHPVYSVMLTLYDAMGVKVTDSIALVTDSTVAVEIKPGNYMAECQVSGSNPAPKTQIKLDGTIIAASDTGVKTILSDRPSYASSVRQRTAIAALDMDQSLTCEANICEANITYYPTKVAAIKVKTVNGMTPVPYGEDCSIFACATDSPVTTERSDDPTIRDIMTLLQSVSGRLEVMETKMGAIENIEKRMGTLEKDISKLWVVIEGRVKKVDESGTRLEDRVDGADIHAAFPSARVQELEKERDTLRDKVSYLQSKSMRNNLIFTGVAEDNSTGNEPPEVTELKLRQHLQDAFKIARDVVDSIKFERVHRSPGSPISGKVRNILAKFTFFKEREMVRKLWIELDGKRNRVFEQCPQDVIEKRRKLVLKMKKARQQGKRAYLVYDTLYVNGTAVKA